MDVSAQYLRGLTLVMTWIILSYLAVLSVFTNSVIYGAFSENGGKYFKFVIYFKGNRNSACADLMLFYSTNISADNGY